jgi:histidine triad (HIT) family protein
MTARHCVFCRIVAGELEKSVVHEDARFLALLDVHPWRPGHVLVMPKAHRVRVAELDDAAALFALGMRVAAALRASDLGVDDVHYLVNDGPAASQSVAHAHLHVIPRRRGDLWRLLVQIARRPLVPFSRPTARAALERQAERIRAALA